MATPGAGGNVRPWYLNSDAFPTRKLRFDAALWVCERRPKVSVGVVELRRLRLAYAGVRPQLAGDVEDLRDVIVSAIQNYCSCYPKTTGDTVRAALEDVMACLQPHTPPA